MRSNLLITYADPAAVGDIQLGVERRTQRNQFDLKQPVFIVDVVARAALTTGANLYSVRRLNGKVTDLFEHSQILPANANTVKPFLPKGIGVGQIQLIVENLVNDSSSNAAVLNYTFDKPLVG